MKALQRSIQIGVETITAGERRFSRFVFAGLLLLLSARFSAAQIPVVTVNAATNITSTSARVTGTVNPNGVPAAFSLQWGLTAAYGSATYFYPVAAVSTPTNVAAVMSNLTSNTTYHYRLIATNSSGTGYSAYMTVTTTNGPGPGSVPTVTANAATDITSVSATISGTVNPNGASSGCWALWGTTTAYDHFTPLGYSLVGSAPVPVSNGLTGLTPNTTYHYQLVATNSAGQATTPDQMFTTGNGSAQVPAVTVDPASQITSTGAVVTGTVNPQGQAAACYVEWGANTAYGTVGPIVPVPAAATAVAVSNLMVYLSPSTTYHYRLVATNGSGAGYSTDMMMTTATAPAGQPPSAVTSPATDISTTSANLWALVGSGGLFTTYYFRWGLDTNYGNALPSGWVPIGQQNNVYQSLSGLNPGTTYHFQIVATNTAGTTFGNDQVFITQGFLTNNADVYTYFITNGTIMITAYSGPGGQVTIPSTMLGLPVTTIGDGAFVNISTLTSVTIPNSVTVLGIGAFADDMGLTNVTLPNSLTSISANAFSSSGLTSLVIPDSITNIGDGAFGSCSKLASLDLGNGVVTIEGQAFSFCTSLTNVTIPDSVTALQGYVMDFGGPLSVFDYCTSLTNVTIGRGLTYLAPGCFAGCSSLLSVLFLGNAPEAPEVYFIQAFRFDASATVYYLPGTTGWGPTFCGLPTVLLGPPGPSIGTLGMQRNGFKFSVTGTPGAAVVIEASTNAAPGSWVPVQSCSLTNGLLQFSDPDSTNYPMRFYRVHSP